MDVEGPMKLNDPKLLREQAYVDGLWIDADNHERFAVSNPANGQTLAQA